MKYLKGIFEDFTDDTLSVNNNTYNYYLKNNTERAEKVAWSAEGSQLHNFSLVASQIRHGDSILDYGCGLGDFSKYLQDNKIEISKYYGVDINSNFIEIAKKTYPDLKFKTIKSVQEIIGRYDVVCAIGVFTWFISKDEFIETIKKLHQIANKKVVLTFLTSSSYKHDDSHWSRKYRTYSEEMLKELFPDFDMEFANSDNTLLVIINKNETSKKI